MIFYKVCICEALCDITFYKTSFVKMWFDLKLMERVHNSYARCVLSRGLRFLLLTRGDFLFNLSTKSLTVASSSFPLLHPGICDRNSLFMRNNVTC